MKSLDILMLSRADIASLNLTPAKVVETVELALREHAAGTYEMHPKIGVHPTGTDPANFIHAMPAYLKHLGACGLKWVGGFAKNHQRDLPNVTGLQVYNDTDTGIPLSVMDCSLLTGFLFMEWMSLHVLSWLLLIISLLWVRRIAPTREHRIRATQITAAGTLLVGSFWWLYEYLQYKHEAKPGMRFAQTIESRHGVITVDTSNAVYGNGAYDGMIGTKLEPKSWLVRPYFLSAVRDRIENVLVIGVASGSWTQILVNHPQVKKVTAIELSHGYLDLIRSRPEVASLLTNPKLELVIDDGRRWLRQHPDARFDAIVMNTTHHWREFASALLSREFLTEVKAHLTPGGIAFWNCTESPCAARTGMEVFPHTLMVMNHCLGSNAPLEPDRKRWRKILADYRIDGQPVIAADHIDGVLDFLNGEQLPVPGDMWHWCRREAMQQAWGTAQIITDDNLGHEYR